MKEDLESKIKPSRKRVRFRFVEPDADAVAVVGDFNQWDQMRHGLKRTANGTWEKVIFLGPGSYEYKFLVDGQWRMDPQNSCECMNPYGTHNNVLIVSRD